MKLIPLTQDKYACVDDADYGWISQFKWHAEKATKSRTFYASTNVNDGTRRTVRMHQLLCPFATHVDHINRNGLLNVRRNLRAATSLLNNGNTAKISRKCTSRFKGVNWQPKRQTWLARVCHKYIGAFATEIEAAHAYDKAAVIAFGEFARLNFPAPGQRGALDQH
jgi:hypothetical protein